MWDFLFSFYIVTVPILFMTCSKYRIEPRLHVGWIDTGHLNFVLPCDDFNFKQVSIEKKMT